MQIHRVRGDLILTSRLADMGHLPAKVLDGVDGKVLVALDPVGTKPGDWVFSIANSAARDAAGSKKILTDLTVAGIIDNWEQD
jgi:carboxysome peptide B